MPVRSTLAQLDAVIRLFEPVGNPELIPSVGPATRGPHQSQTEPRDVCRRFPAGNVGGAGDEQCANVGPLVPGEMRHTFLHFIFWRNFPRGCSKATNRGCQVLGTAYFGNCCGARS